MERFKSVLFATLMFLLAGSVYSQCSDAGICIIGSDHNKSGSQRSSFSFEYSLGRSGNETYDEYEYTVHEFKLGGNFVFSKTFSLSAVLPFMSVVYSSDYILSRNGIADATVMANYHIPAGKLKNFTLMGGLKLATSGLEPDKFSYFNAMGSNDIIIGADFNYSFLNMSAGFQVPVTNYEDDGVKFKRGPDFMFRAGYLRKADNLLVRFEVLGIKRLVKSEYSSSNLQASEIKDSDFFQLNLMGGLMYNFSRDLSGGLNVFLPMLKREDNSDGTKRSFTVAAKFSYAFDL